MKPGDVTIGRPGAAERLTEPDEQAETDGCNG